MLESQVQGHLDLARPTNGFIHGAEADRAIIERGEGWSLAGCAAAGRSDGCTGDGETIEELVLGNGVEGDIEAGCIGDVENLEVEREAEARSG